MKLFTKKDETAKIENLSQLYQYRQQKLEQGTPAEVVAEVVKKVSERLNNTVQFNQQKVNS